MKKEKLIVPVYLNQKIVFDLLAMLQDGISTVTAITENSGETSSHKEKLSVGFGLNEALSSLLKVDLSGKQDKNRSKRKGSQKSEERVHTPASLLFNLRNLLIQTKYVKELTENFIPSPGDIIEFEGDLRRNPVIETLDSLLEIMKTTIIFSKDSPEKIETQKKERKKLKKLSDSLKVGNTIDLIAEELISEYKAVITVECDFLNDPLMSDLVDGRFKILGKVIRKVGEDDAINLLRKSALSKMPPPVLSDLLSIFKQLSSTYQFNLSELQTEIQGPAFQVIPIAIYA